MPVSSWYLRAVGVARHPKPEQHLQPVPLGDLRHLVEAEIDRIGAHAIGQLAPAGPDLPRSARARSGSKGRAGSAGRGTAHRRRSRASRPDRAAKAASAPPAPSHHQAPAMIAAASVNKLTALCIRDRSATAHADLAAVGRAAKVRHFNHDCVRPLDNSRAGSAIFSNRIRATHVAKRTQSLSRDVNTSVANIQRTITNRRGHVSSSRVFFAALPCGGVAVVGASRWLAQAGDAKPGDKPPAGQRRSGQGRPAPDR